jgi:hypothetical protein
MGARRFLELGHRGGAGARGLLVARQHDGPDAIAPVDRQSGVIAMIP